MADHKSRPPRIPKAVTKKKLKSVSQSVMPVWKIMLPSRIMEEKQRMTRDGELKIKSLMRPRRAESSQSARKAKRTRTRRSEMSFLLRFLAARNSCCARVSFGFMIHLRIKEEGACGYSCRILQTSLK